MKSCSACWAADSLNGLNRLNGVRSRPVRGRRRSGTEAGKLATVSWHASPMRVWLLPVHQTYRCVFRGGFVPNPTAVLEKTARNPQRRMPARPIFLNGLKRGTPRPATFCAGRFESGSRRGLDGARSSGEGGRGGVDKGVDVASVRAATQTCEFMYLYSPRRLASCDRF